MSIHFLFTKSEKFGSKLIRWGLNESCSHFAVGFDIGADNRGVIFHSNFHGLGIAWASDFLKNYELVYCLEPAIPLQLQAEERLYQSVVKNYGQPYDFKGLAFFAVAAIGQRIFGGRIRRNNPWGDNKALLCTEVAEQMRLEIEDIFKVPLPLTRGLISPDQLFNSLKQSNLLKMTRY